LKACAATLYFIETPQQAIPTQFPVINKSYIESEGIDKEEGYLHEMMRYLL